MGTAAIGLGEQAYQQGAARRQDVEDQARQAQAQLLYNQWQQTTAPAQRQAIQTEFLKLYPPEKAHHFLSDIQNLASKATGGTLIKPAPAQVAQSPTASAAWQAIFGIPSASETATAAEARKQANAVALENLRAKSALDVANARLKGNLSLEKLDAATRSIDPQYADWNSAPPDVQMKAVAAVGTAGRAPQKPTYEWNQAGHLIAVKTGPDGGQVVTEVMDSQGQPIGKFDPVRVTKREGNYHFVDAAGNVHSVPENSETSSFFEPMIQRGQATPAASPAPVSAKTPSSPGAVNAAAINARTNKKKSQTKQIPTSQGTHGVGRILGNKGSPLLKSDQAQYTKVAEDANAKQEAYQSAQAALRSPSASSDQELIYSWVRANVQGAGRMTQAEFQQAARIGSLPQRAQIAWERLKTGKLPPEIEQMLLADIKRASDTASDQAAVLRRQVQQDMGGGQPAAVPVSANTPPAPGQKSLSDRLNDALGGK